MPPVEFDTIPRSVSHSVNITKDSIGSGLEVLEVGSFKPIITRSSGISPDDSGIIEDVEVPEVSSDDETTVDKIMKDYSEESADDADYVPSEDGEEDHDLEYDSDASVSDEEIETFTRTDGPAIIPEGSMVIEDVGIPKGSSDVVEDVAYAGMEAPATFTNILDYAASYSIVQTGIKTLDFGLNIAETTVSPFSAASKDLVQGVRRNLRAVRRSGLVKEGAAPTRRSLRDLPSRRSNSHGFTGKVNWLLSFADISLTTIDEPTTGRNTEDDEDSSDDDETTVYKLMKEYDSEDDVDYVPCDASMDSLEFYSDCSDDETTVDKLMKDYSEDEDSDFVPCEESQDTLEYDSDAEISQDSFDEYSEIDSEDETTVDKIMKEYSEDSADSDYVPAEESEDDLEYDSEASDSESDCEENLLQIEDVDIPLENSTGILDATTISKIMEECAEESADEDYLPSEESHDSLEFDTDASISEDDSESDVAEDVEDSQDSDEDSLEEPLETEVTEHQPMAQLDGLADEGDSQEDSENEEEDNAEENEQASQEVQYSQEGVEDSQESDEDSVEEPLETEVTEHQPMAQLDGLADDEGDSQEDSENEEEDNAEENEQASQEVQYSQEGASDGFATEVVQDSQDVDSQEDFEENEEELREDEEYETGFTTDAQDSQEVERIYEQASGASHGFATEVVQDSEDDVDSREDFEEDEEELREDEEYETGLTAYVQDSQEVERVYEQAPYAQVVQDATVYEEVAYSHGAQYSPVQEAMVCEDVAYSHGAQYSPVVLEAPVVQDAMVYEDVAYSHGATYAPVALEATVYEEVLRQDEGYEHAEVQYSQEVERAFQEEFDGFSEEDAQNSQEFSEED